MSIGEPLGLRLTGGGRLSAIVTGLDRKQQGSSVLVPPAPREVVEGVAGEVLGSHAPVTEPLQPHGPRARTRRWSRALMVPLALTALVVAGEVVGELDPVGTGPRGAAAWPRRPHSPPTGPGRSGTPWSDGTSWSARAACSASARPSRPARSSAGTSARAGSSDGPA